VRDRGPSAPPPPPRSHMIQSACLSKLLIATMWASLRRDGVLGRGPPASGEKSPFLGTWARASGRRWGYIALAPSRPHDLAFPPFPSPSRPCGQQSPHQPATQRPEPQTLPPSRDAAPAPSRRCLFQGAIRVRGGLRRK
jgi:hypothetical protein